MKKVLFANLLLTTILLGCTHTSTNPLTTKTIQKNIVNDCDRLAAHPNNTDNAKGIVGIDFDDVDGEKAVQACLEAVYENPNHPRYQYQLARAYQASSNYKSALLWHHKSANQNYAPAHNCIGAYNSATGDSHKAFSRFTQSAQAGYSTGQYNLATMYEFGESIEKSMPTAFSWYKKSAEQGYAKAQYQLAEMYSLGQGTAMDKDKALIWYRKAESNGFKEATNKIKELTQ